MNIGPITHRCGVCGEQWWDAHCCPKQTPPMTVAGFFAEAKRLNLRMLGTPEETRTALDLKDSEIERLRAALEAARPAMREYAAKNPKHHFGETLQDPCGVHAWLAEFGA